MSHLDMCSGTCPHLLQPAQGLVDRAQLMPAPGAQACLSKILLQLFERNGNELHSSPTCTALSIRVHSKGEDFGRT